jgi:hypothetical protein
MPSERHQFRILWRHGISDSPSGQENRVCKLPGAGMSLKRDFSCSQPDGRELELDEV